MSFTKRQSKIIEHLEELDPKIADAFKGGIEVLEANFILHNIIKWGETL